LLRSVAPAHRGVICPEWINLEQEKK